jgi:hypothetical protein
MSESAMRVDLGRAATDIEDARIWLGEAEESAIAAPLEGPDRARAMRAIVMAKTKLEEAEMWIERALR